MRRTLFASLMVAASLFSAEAAHADDVVRLSLETWKKANDEIAELTKANEVSAHARPVAIGETSYRGRSDGRNLHLSLTLRAQLGPTDAYKAVDIVGIDAVVASARRRSEQIPLTPHGAYWAWLTRESGPVELEVEIVVPPRGPRGSIEYRFGVVESPVTELVGFFPTEGLSPIVSGAVTNQVRSLNGGTELFAVLSPTREIHIVGFHDVDDGEARTAKLYGRTENLVSISDDSVELFAVVAYTILYAPEKRFRIKLPEGYELVSAEGEGAFQYAVEPAPDGNVLVGETAFGMPSRYEISLRLRRPLATTEHSVMLPIPKLLDVERDVGFVGIEIPGKITVERVDAPDLKGIDARELPPAIVKSSVSPVVRAFRYSGERKDGKVELARHPEKALAAGGIDVLRATTVATGDGRLMTDLLFTIRNNLQQYLALELGDGTNVVSAVLDGAPIKPSRDGKGRVLVPLRRSKTGPSGLVPFRVQLVYEQRIAELGAIGKRSLELPRLEVPVASLDWSVYVPQSYAAAEIESPISAQQFVKNARWHRGTNEPEIDLYDDAGGEPGYRDEIAEASGLDGSEEQEGDEGEVEGEGAGEDVPPEPAVTPPPADHGAGDAGERATGAMPVRVQIPRDGKKLVHQRFWIDAGEPIHVGLLYARTPLPLAAELAAVLGIVLLALFGHASRRAITFLPAAAATVAVFGAWGTAPAIIAIAIAALAIAIARGAFGRAKTELEAKARARWDATQKIVRLRWSSLTTELKERRRENPYVAYGVLALRFSWICAKLGALAVLGIIFTVEVISLLALLKNPL